MVYKKNPLKKDYINDIKNDLEVLVSIKNDWKILKNKDFQDPKLTRSKKSSLNNKKDPKRKIIVFTEFSDTANYLFNN